MRKVAMWLFVLSARAAAQDVSIPDVTYPVLAAEAASAERFVPKGWKLDHKQVGDLNGDNLDDLMFVLIDDDPRNMITDDSFSENPVNTNPRILGVAIQQRPKLYKLVLQNHTLIPRIVEPMFEDPFQKDGSLIKNGTFKMAFYGFGGEIWQPILQFKYQNGGFDLIGYENFSSERSTGVTTNTSVNYLTGEAKISTGSIENDATKNRSTNIEKSTVAAAGKNRQRIGFSALSGVMA